MNEILGTAIGVIVGGVFSSLISAGAIGLIRSHHSFGKHRSWRYQVLLSYFPGVRWRDDNGKMVKILPEAKEKRGSSS